MDLGLKDKVAIVTGASRGIGFATAERLLKEGARVAICARDQGRLDEAKVRLQTHGDVLAVSTDTSLPAAREAFVRAAVDRFGRVDMLVNNAGTHVRASVDDMTDEQL